MRQNGDTSSLVYAVHQLLHRREAQPPGDAISKNVDITAVEGKLQPGYDEKPGAGKTLAKPDVLFHSRGVEYFSVVANGCKMHADLAENLNQALERLLAVGKDAVDVQYTLQQRHLSLQLRKFNGQP